MGNFHSSPAKDETRRSNRLSKPLTKKLALSSPQLSQPEGNAPELASGLIGWENPWVGSHISTEIRSNGPKAREIPPTLFETGPDSPEQSDVQSPVQSLGSRSEPAATGAGSFAASSSIRRASYQPGTFGNYSQLSLVEEPRRANSIQTPPKRHSSVIYESAIEDAASSNTAFMVGNQRFSLTRRRSLLTRPGVATRRTTSAVRRVPSPIGEPEVPVDDLMGTQCMQWPLPPRQRPSLPAPPPPPPPSPPPSMRPTSPADPRYTQLGALKLGSLRVVNGAVSPCPSERIPLGRTHTSGPVLHPDGAKSEAPTRSVLEIPNVSDLKKADDVPGSPFSFDKSPVVAAPPRTKSILAGDSEDEGIVMSDEGNSLLEQTTIEAGIDQSASRSLNKSDSGYSSATSVRSFQRSQTRESFDSQTSVSCAMDSTKAFWPTDDVNGVRSKDQVQRRLSRASSKNFSQLHLDSSRWHDGDNRGADYLARSRTRRTTLCAPRDTEYPLSDDLVPIDPQATLSDAFCATTRQKPVSTRAQLYGDRFSTCSLDVKSPSWSSTALERQSSQVHRASTGAGSQLHRSASEHSARRSLELSISQSRSRSQRGSRVWGNRPSTEVPPLPTILSPDHLNTWEEMEAEYPLFEARRGRPRSRSQDHRRRRLTKARPQSELFI